MTTLNPEILRLARRSRGSSQAQLSAASGLSKSKISKLEWGLELPGLDEIAALAEALRYPFAFLTRPEIPRVAIHAEIFHRKRSTMSQNRLQQAYALGAIRRLEIRRLLLAADHTPPAVPEYDVEDYDVDPAKIARTLRHQWQMPDGPVFNLTRAVEENGCYVFAHQFNDRKLDAFSQRSNRADDCPPLIHANADLPPDRWRWTLTHEIGHIVMHFDPAADPKDIERQANEFAGEFLAPAHLIRNELRNLTIPRLAGLKREWKISMSALVMHARNLGCVTADQSRRLFIALAKDGYKTREPATLDPPVERPSAAYEIVRQLMGPQFRYSLNDVLELLTLNRDCFDCYYSDPLEQLLYGTADSFAMADRPIASYAPRLP